MADALYGDWDKALKRLREANGLMARNLDMANSMNGVTLRDEMKRTITSGNPSWAPNAPLTAGRKGSNKQLIDHGDLRRSIASKSLAGKRIFFVGVPSTKGKEMVNIAAVQEYGHPGIKPKKGKFLILPVSRKASRLLLQYKSARNIPGLFRPFKSLVLAIPREKYRVGRLSFEILFVLVKRVKIPPRSFIGSTFQRIRKRLLLRYHLAAAAAVRGEHYSAG